MSDGRTREIPIVRNHEPDDEACLRALETLLNIADRRCDDRKEIERVPVATSIPDE